MLDIDRERDVPARRGDERIRDMAEIASDQRKQVGGLLVWIAPDREVAAGRIRFARGFQIAVGEQHRRFGPIRLEPHAIDREHVGPIEEIGDAAKSLRLALRAIGGARAIEAHELGVGRRIEARLDRQRERAPRRPSQQEPRRTRLETGRVDRLAVQSGGDKHELVAIERKRRAAPAGGIGAQRQGRDNARHMDVERHVKLDVIDEIIRFAIVAKANSLSVRRTHGRPFKVFEILETIRPERSRSLRRG